MEDAPEVARQQGEWSIEVRSKELDIFDNVNNPVHHYIVVRDDKGEFVTAFHGLAVDRDTYQMTQTGTHADAILAVPISSELRGMWSSVKNTTIFEGSRADVLQKVAMAADAANFINQQNLPYDLVGIGHSAQNSNSVAYTLVKAMDLEFPEDNTALWDPGAGRILLPEDWRSAYADRPLTDKEMEYLKEHYIENRLGEDDVVNIIKNAEDPNTAILSFVQQLWESDNVFFNPKNPNVPYDPVDLSVRPEVLERITSRAEELSQEYVDAAEAIKTNPEIAAKLDTVMEALKDKRYEDLDADTKQMVDDILDDGDVINTLYGIAEKRENAEAMWKIAYGVSQHLGGDMTPEQIKAAQLDVISRFEGSFINLPDYLAHLPAYGEKGDKVRMEGDELKTFLDNIRRDMGAFAEAMEPALIEPEPLPTAEPLPGFGS